MGTNEDRTKLLEVAMILVLNFGNTPGVLTTLDDTTIRGLDILLAADDREWHCRHESTGVLDSSFVVLFERRLVDFDALRFNDGADAVFETSKVGGGQSVCLGNDWNEVDTGTKSLHNFDVERLEGVARGTDEVEAGVHPEVDLVGSAGLLLL